MNSDSVWHTDPVNRQTRAQPLAFDAEGFLTDPHSWNRKVASWIAREDGIEELTDAHWRVIYYLREYHRKFGCVPLMRLVCRANEIRREDIKTLFGSCRQIWRISGLPDPGEEAKTYM
jgi:TusE/DsrC/DsvC family sulfur relay protein